MNYFCHGEKFVDSPYFVAGTAIPDWLGVVDRRVRAKSRGAIPLTTDSDLRVSQVALGIIRHHEDDRWFHGTRVFNELCLEFSCEIREILADDQGFRPSFLGHILIELLLDDARIRESPERLDLYYAALGSVDPKVVEAVVEKAAGKSAPLLVEFIPRFVSERFLYDYADDEKLLRRLNQVMRRVRLTELPQELCKWFPTARHRVRQKRHELLASNIVN